MPSRAPSLGSAFASGLESPSIAPCILAPSGRQPARMAEAPARVGAASACRPRIARQPTASLRGPRGGTRNRKHPPRHRMWTDTMEEGVRR
ncbi:hypothetical protein HPP92_013917 [Vanilla planifolia]|uniref:Uncharacterized protein n=1 Tax=Vanilla planifolia TaxID=51239 RepID=A0A835QTZ6_VANPL|nr:hypothetical protein HPP92_013917 [Vanilla planifolia]